MSTSFAVSKSSLSDEQLLANVKSLASVERKATADLIAALAEVDRRKLYLGEGFPSLFSYCTQVLHLSEHAAYGRIEAARAVHRFPAVLDHLAEGALTLTTVCLLAPLMTAENHETLLAAAGYKSRRDVEHLVAVTRPKPDVPAVVRRLPSPCSQELWAPRGESAHLPVSELPSVSAQSQVELRSAVDEVIPPGHPKPTAVVMPLAPERYKIQFTASRGAYEKLRRVQALLRHVIPTGDPAVVFERALDVLLADLERRKLATTNRPRPVPAATPGSRHIPAAVRREVWRRDGARCAFVGAAGRCAERGFLELHHVVPFANGGEATTANIELRCRAHNAYEAELSFGSFVLRERPIDYNLVRTELTCGATFVPPTGAARVGESPLVGWVD